MISELVTFIFQLLGIIVSSEKYLEIFNEFLFGLDIYERELEKRNTPFFGGNKPGMLDFMIWPWCEKTDVIKILRGEQFILPQKRFLRLV